MTAPVAVVRQPPAGIKLKDGFKTLITLNHDPDVEFWEKTVKPPGIDGGNPIEQTTMHNTAWRTKAPRSLRTLTESTTKVAYDPVCYTSILASINLETTITIRFPDGTTVAFYGFLESFEPDELKEGDQPEATVKITPTNFDPVAHVEAAPTVVAVAGT